MREELAQLAQSLNYQFGFGTKSDLEALAQTVTSGFVLFHEGYFTADLNLDGQGALEYRHRLTLDICLKSLLTDAPEVKAEHLTSLDIELRKVYKALTKMGSVSGARATTGLNLTTANLDAVQLTLTLLPDAVSLCKL